MGPGTIELAGVTKVYERHPPRTVLDRFRRTRQPEATRSTAVALDGVDLRIPSGQSIGVIGPNGAGKSTLLRLIAGVTAPTRGRVDVAGHVGAMIDLGLGFHPDLTGWENLGVTSVLLGMTPDESEALRDEIAAFSGILEALDKPLRTYSTGMKARLGFALATHVPASILVIDEVLTVGDREFQERCLARVDQLIGDGTSVIFVSHTLPLVTRVCQRAIQIRDGRVVDDGPAAEVVERYLQPTPSRFRRSPRSPARWVSRSPEVSIDPWDPITFDAEIEVGAHGSGPYSIGVDLTLPTYAPDYVFASAINTVPELERPGRWAVTGTSSPFPGRASVLRAVLTLVDRDRMQIDQTSVEVRVGGGPMTSRTRLAISAVWTIEPVPPPETPADLPHAPADESGAAVVLTDVWKRFPAVPDARRGGRKLRRPDLCVEALRGVSLQLHRSSVLGVIGPNGSGKTTLLRTIARITRPERGSVEIRGHVVPLLDLGLAFQPDLTGWENLEVTARLLGMSERFAQSVLGQVQEFSGLSDDVLRSPVGRYSSGMRARLGFALAAHSNPEVLLIDELLAVGDQDFRRKAIDAVRQLRDEGSAVVLVSHELRLVEEMCDRAVRLEGGRIVDEGRSTDVVGRYGSTGWAGGLHDGGSAIRLHPLSVHPRRVDVGATVEISGLVEVAEPSTDARIEVSYRVPPEDRTAVLTPEELDARTVFVRTVEPAGGMLATAGWARFTCIFERNEMIGEFDVVVSVISERDNEVVSESWETVIVGESERGRFPGPALTFTWSAQPA